MQITEIPQIKPKPNNINKQQPLPAFKGFDKFVVNTMEAIDRGGLVASFTTQDLLGTTLPRPIAALSRNEKENNGKKNTTFALKEALREFTTGPSMFAIPAIILIFSKKAFGKAMDVPAKFIRGMGEIYKSAPLDAQGAPITKVDFYKNVFSNILKNSAASLSADELQSKACEFASDLLNIEKAKPKNFIKNFRGIFVKGSRQDLTEELLDKFVSTMKLNNESSLVDYTVGTIDVSINRIKTSAPFKKIISYMQNYSNDIVDKTTKTVNVQSFKPSSEKVSELINNINAKRITGRFALNIIMFAAIMTFLPLIPKIYNVSKDNPALRGLENPIKKGQRESVKKGAV